MFVYSTRAHPRVYVFDNLFLLKDLRRYGKEGYWVWVLRSTVCSADSW